MKFGKEYHRVIHDNQLKVCSLCYSDQHLFKDCPQFVCFTCGGQGHFRKTCKTQPCTRCGEVRYACDCVRAARCIDTLCDRCGVYNCRCFDTEANRDDSELVGEEESADDWVETEGKGPSDDCVSVAAEADNEDADMVMDSRSEDGGMAPVVEISSAVDEEHTCENLEVSLTAESLTDDDDEDDVSDDDDSEEGNYAEGIWSQTDVILSDERPNVCGSPVYGDVFPLQGHGLKDS
ncbi:uncharacterized protein LOC132545779 [Ylistrum balloti]|nr:uncharacterized protein LOC132545779 [Ylistrum balloti]